MEAITNILDYANDHGVWPVLFLGLLLFGIPWLLKREKAHADKLESVNKARLEEIKNSNKGTQDMALAFNDTVNKFNGTIDASLKKLESFDTSLERITVSLASIADVQSRINSTIEAEKATNTILRNELNRTTNMLDQLNNKLK